MLAMVAEEYPDADVLAPRYFDSRLGVLSNANPYEQADALEVAIHRQFESKPYEHVLLIGHSMGASLRKALVWAHGEEADRPARRGRRDWARKVERFVSLAGINRGWTINPRPENMPRWRAMMCRFGLAVATATGTGRFIRDLQRGAPFVADLRVQWMKVA